MHDLAFSLGGQVITPPNNFPHGGLSYAQIVIKNAVTILLILVVLLAIIFIVYAGFQWATSGGDKSKLAAARSKVTWSIVGLIIAFLAFLFITFIGFFFNAPL